MTRSGQREVAGRPLWDAAPVAITVTIERLEPVQFAAVDVQRKRVSLTMRMSDEAPAPGEKRERTPNRTNQQQQVSRSQPKPSSPEAGGALADALRKAGLASK